LFEAGIWLLSAARGGAQGYFLRFFRRRLAFALTVRNAGRSAALATAAVPLLTSFEENFPVMLWRASRDSSNWLCMAPCAAANIFSVVIRRISVTSCGFRCEEHAARTI